MKPLSGVRVSRWYADSCRQSCYASMPAAYDPLLSPAAVTRDGKIGKIADAGRTLQSQGCQRASRLSRGSPAKGSVTVIKPEEIRLSSVAGQCATVIDCRGLKIQEKVRKGLSKQERPLTLTVQ